MQLIRAQYVKPHVKTNKAAPVGAQPGEMDHGISAITIGEHYGMDERELSLEDLNSYENDYISIFEV